MSLSLFYLTGKTALVTGATHGPGMSMDTGLAKAGAQIIVNDMVQEKLDSAVALYVADGIKAHGYFLM